MRTGPRGPASATPVAAFPHRPPRSIVQLVLCPRHAPEGLEGDHVMSKHLSRLPAGLAAAAALVLSHSALAVPASYAPTSLDGQNGWNGGNPCLVFVNNDAGDETVQAAEVRSGSQAWAYRRGYGSPGCGTPFSPQMLSAVGRPSSG